jgi:hypothetical protein
MVVLRQLLRWSFALVAIALPPATVGVAGKFVRFGAWTPTPAADLLLAGFFGVAVIFAMACWTTRRPRYTPSAWAIAASLLHLAAGVFFLRYASRFTSAGPQLALIAAGIAGLCVFCRRDALPGPYVHARKTPRMAGDHTSPWVDRAVTFLFCAAAYGSSRLWANWADARGLASHAPLSSIALILLAILATSALHELGHAVAALSLGMRLLAFNAGPFQWRKREGRWGFRFHASGLVTLGGAVSVVPTRERQPRWQDVCMIAAGPCASICFGLLALWATLSGGGAFYARAWEFIADLASFSLIAAVLNLLPFRAQGGAYSDGARILQLLTASPVAGLHRALVGFQSTLVTVRRLRDLDAEAMEHTAARFTPHLSGLHLRLCAVLAYDDAGRPADARRVLGAAEDSYNDFKIDIPCALHTVFIYGHACLNRDAPAARLWWDRMQAKQPKEACSIDYWLARTALLWTEGRRADAEHAWQMAEAKVRHLPRFGAYEYDRYRCALLRQELDLISPVETARAPVPAHPWQVAKPAAVSYPIFGINPIAAAAE